MWSNESPRLTYQGILTERGPSWYLELTRGQIVVWLEGNRRLGIIESASLAHALAYEKLIQKGYRLDPQGVCHRNGSISPVKLRYIGRTSHEDSIFVVWRNQKAHRSLRSG